MRQTKAQISLRIRCLDSIISKLAKPKISILYLFSVAEQVGLSPTWSQTLEDRFSRLKW